MMPNTTPNQVTMPEKWQVPRYLPLKKKILIEEYHEFT